MRSIIFLLLVICMGTLAQAQKNKLQEKVKIINMPVAVKTIHPTKTAVGQFPTMTGIYILKHSRIKKALSFEFRKKEIKLV
ncbi:hypothetical protein [Maribacter sp. 2304DJ31-5]|uniref:hypothetical protein n=1 Tax=Maribacter sp. 2304DJ31-5 TaxID=3386273 RepID=UPI0039BC23BD